MQRSMRFLLVIAVLLVGVGLGVAWRTDSASNTRDRPGGELRFRELREEVGIKFSHFNAPRSSVLPEDVGSGAGWGDFDGDGDEDLYLVNFAGPFLMDDIELSRRNGNRLFRNDGQNKFVDVTRQSGVGHIGWDYACLWFDYDNDGWLDLAVTHYQGIVLYRNRGDQTFEDVTARAGMDGIQRFLLGLTAADYDHDGDLDLYLCGYVTFDREAARNRPLVAGRPAVWTNPVSYPAEANLLLQNDGHGAFVDVTLSAQVANETGKSMQALFCDFNNDTWPDLYVANDVGTADVLFLNEGNGKFREISSEAGTHDRRASMGLAVGDLWHRGWFDLFVTHWVAEDHALWKNRTDELGQRIPIVFDDVGPQAGITRSKASAYVGWGTGMYDFDNDGFLDIMLVNGSTIEDELTLDVLRDPKLMPQPAQVLWNNRAGRLIDVSESAGGFFSEPRVSRGLAFADYDLDGRVDAVVVSHNETATLLHNETPNAGHWLAVKLKGSASNRLGVGARILVRTAAQVYCQQRVLGSSYLSSNSYFDHFGLGDQTTIESIEVQWPSGRVSHVKNPQVDQVLTIMEPDA